MALFPSNEKNLTITIVTKDYEGCTVYTVHCTGIHTHTRIQIYINTLIILLFILGIRTYFKI